MRLHLLLFPVFLLTSTLVPLRAQTGDPCDSLGIVATATATSMGCLNPVATLAGVAVPNATGYAWSGPGGFTAATPVAEHWVAGAYTFTVFGPQGCTDQTTVTVLDTCADYPLMPEACPNLAIPTPADECYDACVVPCLPFVLGHTAGFTPSPDPSFCGTIENDQYFAFVAYGPTATFVATPSNCLLGNGLQLAVYEACFGAMLGCNDGSQGGGGIPVALTVNNLIEGKAYYLLVDGYNGDECAFILQQTFPICVPDTVPLIDTTTLVPQLGSDTICTGGTLTYNAPLVKYANAYLWTAPADALIDEQPSPLLLYTPQGHTVSVTAGQQDGYVCRRSLYFFSPPGPPVCRRLVTVQLPVTVLPDVLVCPGDLPYSLPWGASVSVSGTYQTTLQSYQGCDSVVQIEVMVLNPVAEISGPLELTCAQPGIQLQAAFSSANTQYRWRNAQGIQIGAGEAVAVNQPGLYTLEAVQLTGGTSCSAVDTVLISENKPDVEVTASAQALDCAGTPAPISAAGNLAQLTYTWTGPNGFMAAEPDTLVTQPGTYTVLATDPATGCSDTASVVVPAGAGVPDLKANQGPTVCGDSTIILTASSNTSGVTYAWSGPNDFFAEQAEITVALPGWYTVTVTTPAGCQSEFSLLALAPPANPILSLNGSPVTVTCLPATDTLTVSSTPPAAGIVWLGTNGATLGTGPTYVVSDDFPVAVTATTADGCNATEIIEYQLDNNTPDVMAEGAELTCAMPAATLTATSSTPGVSFKWMGPAFVVGPTVTVDQPGIYSVIATAPNGCSATTSVIVVDSCTTSVASALSHRDLRVYPNASIGVFMIEATGLTSAIEQLDVFAADGRLVHRHRFEAPVTTYRCDLEHLPAGPYRLAVRLAGRWRIVALVIVR